MKKFAKNLLVGLLSVSLSAMFAFPAFAANGGANDGGSRGKNVNVHMNMGGLHFADKALEKKSVEESKNLVATYKDSLAAFGVDDEYIQYGLGGDLSFTADIKLKVGETITLHIFQRRILDDDGDYGPTDKRVEFVYGGKFNAIQMVGDKKASRLIKDKTADNGGYCLPVTITALKEGTDIVCAFDGVNSLYATRIIVTADKSGQPANASQANGEEKGTVWKTGDQLIHPDYKAIVPAPSGNAFENAPEHW